MNPGDYSRLTAPEIHIFTSLSKILTRFRWWHLVTCVACFACVAAASAQSTSVPASSGTPNSLAGVAYGGGKFVAVGASGTIVRSTDGQSWSLAAGGTSSGDYCTGATYLDSTYIVTGRSATVHTSADASNWVFQDSVQASGISDWLRSATSNGSHAVAVGDAGRVLSSASGIDWTVQTSGTAANLNAICYGAGIYVAVGDPAGVPLQGLVLTSVDDDGRTSRGTVRLVGDGLLAS